MSDDNQRVVTTSTLSVAPAAAALAAPTASSIELLSAAEQSAIQSQLIEMLRTCYDPELPVDIYELGLIYEVKVSPAAEVYVKMTLTTPNCPVAVSLPAEVEWKARAIPRVKDVKLEIVFDPPWDPSKMTEAARLQLGMF